MLPIVLLLAACGGGDDATSSSGVSAGVVQPSLAVDPLTVGLNRVAFGLVGEHGGLVAGAAVDARFFSIEDQGDGQVTGSFASAHSLTAVDLPQDYEHDHVDGSDHLHQGPNATVYVANVEFPHPEWWGAELTVTVDDEQQDPVSLTFWVEPDTPEPALGEPVPASVQLTLDDIDDITVIDSADPPLPEFHDITVADALEEGRPLVVAFATVAFCQTRFCGPVVEGVLSPLAERYDDQVEFIVIEPFDLVEARSGNLVEMPEMAEWGLTSEPWVFVVDAEGRVAAKFQGITSEAEVGASIEQLLAS